MADKADIQKRVIEVTSKVLKVEPAEIKPDSNFVFDLGAESVDSIALVAAFEKEFGIEMEEEAALEVQSIDKAVEFIQSCVEKK